MNGRRWFLKRAAMAPAAAAMAPGMIAAQAGAITVGGLINRGGAAQAAPTGEEWAPWLQAGMGKKAWRLLDRKRDAEIMRQTQYGRAMFGVLHADIAGLHSLSPAAKARMQVKRDQAWYEEQDVLYRLLYPQRDDD